MAGSSTKANNYNQRKRLMKHYDNKATLPDNITTEEVICQKCGFKARYKFLRCPHCDEVQK